MTHTQRDICILIEEIAPPPYKFRDKELSVNESAAVPLDNDILKVRSFCHDGHRLCDYLWRLLFGYRVHDLLPLFGMVAKGGTVKC